MTYGNYIYCGEHNLMYRIVESLCCSLEADITLFVNYMSIKNRPQSINFINNIASWHFHVYFIGCLRFESTVYAKE